VRGGAGRARFIAESAVGRRAGRTARGERVQWLRERERERERDLIHMSFSNIDARKSASCRRRARAVGWLQPRAAAETSGAAARQKGGGRKGLRAHVHDGAGHAACLETRGNLLRPLSRRGSEPFGVQLGDACAARAPVQRAAARGTVGGASFCHDCYPLGGSKAGDGAGRSAGERARDRRWASRRAWRRPCRPAPEPCRSGARAPRAGRWRGSGSTGEWREGTHLGGVVEGVLSSEEVLDVAVLPAGGGTPWKGIVQPAGGVGGVSRCRGPAGGVAAGGEARGRARACP